LILSSFSILGRSSSASRPLASSSSFTPVMKRPLLSLRSTGSLGAGDTGPFSGAAVPFGLTSLGMAFSAAALAGALFGWGVPDFAGSLAGAAGAGEGPVRAGWAGLAC
jgi:hypothetical protein